MISSLVIIPSVFSANEDVLPTTPSVPTSSVTASDTQDVLPVSTSSPESIQMNAASTTGTASVLVPSVGSSVGEYKTVACSSNALFGANSCDQCFEGNSVKVGDMLTGLFDNWTNTTANILTAYKEEQKMPNMVKIGNTSWITTPADETKMWKYPVDIQWVSSGTGGKSQYILNAGQKVKFIEADMGAKYTLEKTDKKNGEIIGMLRFPVVSHVVDNSGNEGTADTHYECVSYKLSAVIAPVPTTPTTPTPEKMTETKTGPETLILIIAAFFIAFGLMFSLRRRM